MEDKRLKIIAADQERKKIIQELIYKGLFHNGRIRLYNKHKRLHEFYNEPFINYLVKLTGHLTIDSIIKINHNYAARERKDFKIIWNTNGNYHYKLIKKFEELNIIRKKGSNYYFNPTIYLDSNYVSIAALFLFKDEILKYDFLSPKTKKFIDFMESDYRV